MADTLRLAIEPARGDVDGHEVRIWVNDAEVTDISGSLGMSPFSTLIPDNELQATPRPHRARLARCGCGEHGCDPTDVIVTRRADLVQWEWCHHAPLAGPAQFDAAQYEQEIARILDDESWQRPQDTVVRRCFERIDRELLAQRNLTLRWIGPHHRLPELLTFSLDLAPSADDHADYQVFLTMPWQGLTPAFVADVAAELLAAPPDAWRATWHPIRTANHEPPALAGPLWTRFES